MKRSNRLIVFAAIALLAILLLSLIAAPRNNISSGSSYSRSPDGYAAWYGFMEKRGTPLKRWQKPFRDLVKEKNITTLIQINDELSSSSVSEEEKEWVEKGNTLVILGVKEPVTAAKFSTMQKSSVGDITIETRRRAEINKYKSGKTALEDNFGAVVWEKQYGKGKVIFSTTPYIAANAYQDNLNNFNYLAELVANKNHLLLVDEYIHGYKDVDVKQRQGEGDIFSYLLKTPLFPAFVQACILLSVLILALNRRFGQANAISTQIVDNSEAYIQALASVLNKANASEFVVEMIGKEEQLRLQKSLGLGQILLDRDALKNAWVKSTGATSAELDEVLEILSRKSRISEKKLITWLEKWGKISKYKILD
jgi:Domain of unknown function (DUF4350)